MKHLTKQIKMIESILDRSNKQELHDGIIWYTKLNRYCRDLGFKYDMPIWKVTAIMSVLSPRTSFANNVHDLEQVLKYGKNAKLKSPLFREKAFKVYDAKSYSEVNALFNEKTGRKTLSFWENLMLVGDRATIDTHMIQCLGIEGSLTDKKYREAEQAIQVYASKIGIKTFQLQAVLWVIQRKEAF